MCDMLHDSVETNVLIKKRCVAVFRQQTLLHLNWGYSPRKQLKAEELSQ